ncbi:MAG: SCO family protein [Ardenticatenales bacterium]|nr:SCO family protein [Ardenticatenales bacterium]
MAGRKKPQMSARYGALLVLLLFLMVVPSPAQAHKPGGIDKATEAMPPLPDILKQATFDQHPGAALPLNLRFTDDTGQEQTLGHYFESGRPVILSLNYYECDNLCPLVLDGLVRGMNGVALKIGDEFDVVSVSIDPTETPALAAQLKKRFVDRYGRSGAAQRWAFLTGEKAQIDQLAAAVGVNYAYDEARAQYAHPSGVIVITPDGTISRYLYGVEFSPVSLRLALVEAAAGKIGSITDQVLLFCYRYDPTLGTYTPFVLNLVKLGGVLTLVVMSLWFGPMALRDMRQSRLTTGAAD